MPKKNRRKNAQNQNNGGQAMDTRQAVGTPSPGLVRKPQKERGKKGKNKQQQQKAASGGKIVARGGKHGALGAVVDVAKEDCLLRHTEIKRAHGDAIEAILMSDDSVYTASRDKLLKRWKPARNAQGRFEMAADLEVPLGQVCWCLHSAGEWIFCGLQTGAIRAFSKAGAERTLEGHTKKVTCLLTHEHVLLSGGADGTVRLWQMDPATQNFACTHRIEEAMPGTVSCMAVLGMTLWVGGTNGVSLVDLAALKVVSQPGPKKFVAGVLQFSGHMIVVYTDGSMNIFTAEGNSTHSQPPMPAGPVTAVVGLESGPRVLCGHIKGQVSSIELPMFKLKHCWQTLQRCKVLSLCSAGHDGIFLVGAENGDLQLWQRDEAMASLP